LTHDITFHKSDSLLSRKVVITMFFDMLKPNNILFFSQEKHGSNGDTWELFFSTKFSSEASCMLHFFSLASMSDRERSHQLSSGRWLPVGKNKTETTTTY